MEDEAVPFSSDLTGNSHSVVNLLDESHHSSADATPTWSTGIWALGLHARAIALRPRHRKEADIARKLSTSLPMHLDPLQWVTIRCGGHDKDAAVEDEAVSFSYDLTGSSRPVVNLLDESHHSPAAATIPFAQLEPSSPRRLTALSKSDARRPWHCLST